MTGVLPAIGRPKTDISARLQSGEFRELGPPLTLRSPPSPADPKDRLFFKIFEKNENFLGPKGRDFFFAIKTAKPAKKDEKGGMKG